MVYCCVPNCYRRSDRKGGNIDADGNKIAFLKFPRDPVRKREWAIKVRRQGKTPNELWMPSDSSTVCSRHFLPTDFRSGIKIKTLLPSAIPSVFTEDLRRKRPSSERKKRKTAIPSESLPVSSAERDQTFISMEKEIGQTSPLEPKLVQVWSCSETQNGCNPTIATTNEINNLPSFMKQALLEKEKIDLTYEGTSTADINISMQNRTLMPTQSELEDPNINDNVETQTIVTQSPLSNVKMCDASSQVNKDFWIRDTEISSKIEQLEQSQEKIVSYQKQIRNLKQHHRRLRKQITDMKLVIFCGLKNRHHLRKKTDFNIIKKGRLSDRQPVTVCESSDSGDPEDAFLMIQTDL